MKEADGGGPGEPQTQQFIDLDAPSELEEGQNFFDQPPFNILSEEVATRFPVQAETLRRTIPRTARESWRLAQPQGNPWDYESIARTIRVREFIEGLQYSTKMRDIDFEVFREALLTFYGQLNEFPYWAEYVRFKRDPGIYKTDGTYAPRNPNMVYVPAPSYARFASERLEREPNLRLGGIELIFPDTQQEQIRAVNAPALGKGREWRYWRLMKASELIPEKRN